MTIGKRDDTSGRLGHVVGISHGGRRSPGASCSRSEPPRCRVGSPDASEICSVATSLERSKPLTAADPADSLNSVSLLDITIHYWEVASNNGRDTALKQA
jgi:hypothetical protein